MWEAHNLAGEMRHETFQYNHLTLTFGIFHVNLNTFWSFLKFFIKNFSHSTQLSSLTIPDKHHLNVTERSPLLFCFYMHIGLFQLALRAI